MIRSIAHLIAAALLCACGSVPGDEEPKADAPAWWQGWSLDDPRLSQPEFTAAPLEAFDILAGDGVRLDAKVLRPVVPDGVRVPAILHLSPYLPVDITAEKILPELQKHHYVERGYALVGVSLRGFGGSGGCPDYQGARDRADVDAILDTIAAQPWASGKIGAMGLSWDGTSLNAAALSGNPHLATIVPHGSITDWYKWSFMQGVPAWFLGYTFNIYAPPAAWAASGLGGVPPVATFARCSGNVEPPIEQVRTAATGVRTPWWDERDLTLLADQVSPNLAVLQVQGQRDEGVRPDHLHGWEPALRARLPNYRLVLGDWTHLWPDTPNAPAAYNPELEFNKWPLTSWPVLLLRWYDRWLKDKDTGIERMPGALLQDDKGAWHGEDSMEPSRAVIDRLYPSADGGLGSNPAEGTVSFTDNGAGVDPRGTCLYGAAGLFFGCVPVPGGAGTFFAGDAVAQDTRFSGIARAHLRLVHSMPLGHVGVTFYGVAPDGSWTPMTYGIASYNLGDAGHTFVLVERGAAFAQDVELMVRDFMLPAGHRLGLAIGSQVGRNPMGLTGNGFAPVPTGGTTEVRLGADSWIDVPRLVGETAIVPLP